LALLLIGGIVGTWAFDVAGDTRDQVALPNAAGGAWLSRICWAELFEAAGLTPPVNPPEPPVDAAPPDFTGDASIPLGAVALLAFPDELPGFGNSNVAPLGFGAAGVGLAGAACGCESMPPEPGVCDSSIEGVVGRGAATAVDVSLKLMLNAPLPQSISPPVNMNDRVPEGVELQLPPGI